MSFSKNRNRRAAGRGTAIWLAAFAPLAHAENAEMADYVVKAKMLISFAQPLYANWAAVAFADASSPFIIGVIGDDSVAGKIESLAGKQTAGGRRITIRRARQAEELKGCHIVFIGKAENGRAGAILGAANTLTVSDADDFTQQGGAIAFFMKGERIRFHINSKAASRAGIDLTGRLLGAGE